MMGACVCRFESSGGKNGLTCITKTALIIQHSAKESVGIRDGIEMCMVQNEIDMRSIFKRLRAIIDLL